MKDIVLIDKPAGWTSFDVVAKIRGKIRAEYTARGEKPTKKQLRVGHAGTLDPFATGLLIILLGDACKKAGEFLKLDKTYEFTAKLSEVSTTGDPEGEILEYGKWKMENEGKTEDDGHMTKDIGQNMVPVIPATGSCHPELDSGSNSDNSSRARQSIPTSDEVLKVLTQFTGEITQTPPAFSAIKVDGKRAYKLAREGKEVNIPSRKVQIDRLELVEYNFPYLKCVCDVGSGTYIRSLVEDIGKALSTGAYCTELRRTRIGNYSVDSSLTIDWYTEHKKEQL